MTILFDLLVLKLGTRLTKILLETWLGKGAPATLGGDVADLLQGRIQSAADRWKAQRQFEEIGARMAIELTPLFESVQSRGQLNPEPVIRELEATLAGRVTADFLVLKDLDPRALCAELKRLRPLPQAQYSEAEEELYERALERTVRHLVGIASQLPQFEEASITRSLQQLGRLTADSEEILARIRRIEDAVTTDGIEDKNRSYEIEYRLALQRDLDYLELFGIDLYPQPPRQKLSVAYISLSFQSNVEQSSESLPAEALLDRLTLKDGKLLIRGEAGSGKSTFFRWAAIFASAGLDSVTPRMRERFQGSIDNNLKGGALLAADYWRGRIPFLIRLRHCKTGALPSPEGFPELIAREIGAPPCDWVKHVLKEKRGLLLLDGVDEISGAHREATRREIEALTLQYPGNYFLVSTRPTAVEEGWLSNVGFREARINPLSELDRSDFIDRWYGAVTELTSLGSPSEDLPGLAAALKEELSVNHEISRLATNPLLCAMICALYRDRRRKLPENRRELCEALCQALLHRRERESGIDLSEFPESYRRLEYEQKRAAIQELAYSMVLNADSVVPIEKAQEKIGKALRQFRGHSDVSDLVVAEVTAELVVRSGILREESPGLVSFIHNSFKEFLAGDYCADENNAGLLAEKALEPDWQPVVLYAVAGRQRGFATEVIRRIIDTAPDVSTVIEKLRPNENQDSRPRATLRARQLMALRCQAVALFLDEDLKAALDRLAQDLLPPRSMDDAEALASAGESAVQFLLYNSALSEAHAAACVRALRLIGTPQARHTLRGYFSDMRLGVVSELAQAANPLELAWVQEQLRALEILPEGIRAQVVDLSPLSKLSDLQILDLSGTKVTDLMALGKLKDLEVLNLSDTPVSSLSTLSKLTVLQKLELAGTRVENLSPLSNLNTLEDLNLSHTPVIDLSPLSQLRNLKRLSLVGAPVVDISPLAQLKGLKYLYLAGTNVVDLSPLAQLKRLRHIDLAGTPVTELTSLRSLKELEILDVTRTLVRDSSILEHLHCQVYD